MKPRQGKRNGSVLVGLLWCLALLSVAVIGVLHTARMDLRVAKHHGDVIQAQYLALAGIEKAKALLYHDVRERQRSSQNHSGALYNAPDQFREVPLGRGRFSVVRPGHSDEAPGLVYGIQDEERFLNINQATIAELTKLEGMTPEVAAAILDWRDGDNTVTPGGAETDYYAGLQPPSLTRNGSFLTTRELLMTRGVSRDLLLGEDANGNGFLDPEEDDGNESNPPDNHDGILEAGWSGLITVNSTAGEVNAAGQERFNIQSADEKALASVPGLTADLARAIVAYRGRSQLETLADLLEVTALAPQSGAPASAPTLPPAGRTQGPSTGPGDGLRTGARPAPRSTATAPPAAAPAGPPLISEELLMQIADDLTAADRDAAGAININTANAQVLACLPGVSRELAQAIVAYRRSAGFFANIAWLLKVDGMTRAILKQIEGKVTTRSETFRIVSEGMVPSTQVRKRLEVIVRLGDISYQTLAYREDP